jgi:hypothetical protein
MGTQLAHEGAPRRVLARQGNEDAPAFIPVADDAVLPNFTGRLDDGVPVTARVMEREERGLDFIADVLVTRGELVAEHMQ